MSTFANFRDNGVQSPVDPERPLFLLDSANALLAKRTTSGLTKTGTGSGDLLPYGDHTHTTNKSYRIVIDTAGDEGTATFGWSDDGGATFQATNVPVNVNPRSCVLQNNLEVIWAFGTYNLNDRWDFTAIATGSQEYTLKADTNTDTTTVGATLIISRDTAFNLASPPGSNPYINFDGGDFLDYDRSGNEYRFNIVGTGYTKIGNGYVAHYGISTPSTPAADFGASYAKLVNGKARPHWIDEDGKEFNLLATSVARTKETTESVTSSTTLQNDDDLLFAIAANETWAYHMVLFYDGNSSGDLKMDINVPSGATSDWGAYGQDASDAYGAIAPTSGAGTAVWGASAFARTVIIDGRVKNGSTAGNVQLRWAQNSSNATATRILSGSHLTATRVV